MKILKEGIKPEELNVNEWKKEVKCEKAINQVYNNKHYCGSVLEANKDDIIKWRHRGCNMYEYYIKCPICDSYISVSSLPEEIMDIAKEKIN